MPIATAPPLTLREVFARNVRVLRVNNGVSQEALADQVQLDRTFIGSLERGERNISIDNVERIAKVLGYAPHELLDPDFPRLHNLDVTLTRAPRSSRLYPPEGRTRKASKASGR